MTNRDVIAALEEIAVLLELAGENPFKSRSYENAARTIEMLDEDLATLVQEKRLREVKGIGQALEQKIAELMTTGHLEYLEELRSQFPPTLFELFGISSLGAQRIRRLYTELDVTSLADLERACEEGRVRQLKGFGPKMEEKIREGIEFARRHQGFHLVPTAAKEAVRLRDWVGSHPAAIRVVIAGSLRRCKEVIKDIDLVAASNEPEALMNHFVAASGVASVTGQGETKSSVVLDSGIAVDLRVVDETSFPYALHHFTGSKEHNIVMRRRAKERGLKLNEYGLFREDTLIPCADEAAIFASLDLPYIPPELREDMGEFDTPALPRLVVREDLRGVFHCHTTYSDGRGTVTQMAEAAMARGYQYIVISDHSVSAGYAGGLHPNAVAKQQAEIDVFNAKTQGFRILKSIESDIRLDGSLDYDDDILATFDLVIASIHSKQGMTEAEATARVLRAVENPYTTILGHPTGRLLLTRQGYPLDFDRVFEACRACRVAIEINANAFRLDLDWRHVRRARDCGVMLVIGVDAHDPEGLDDVMYGLNVARKGWLEALDLLNSQSAEDVLKWHRSKRP